MELGDDVPVVLAAARHEYQKGLDVLLDAIASIRRDQPNIVLLLAGRDGNRTAALRYQATRLGLDDNVRFLGARDDIPDLMVAADVFVLPSRWEGLPGAVIEAMALETPVVATDLPGVREVLGPELLRGWVVPVGDASALASRISGHDGRSRRDGIVDRLGAESVPATVHHSTDRERDGGLLRACPRHLVVIRSSRKSSAPSIFTMR